MRKKTLITILCVVFIANCSPVKIEPSFSKNYKGDESVAPWIYHVDKRITEQLQEKGFIRVQPEDATVIAYGIIGTWTKEDDFSYGRKFYLQLIDPNATKKEHDVIFGKMEFQPEYRRAAWFFMWSFSADPNEIDEAWTEVYNLYKKNIHKKL